MDSTLAHCVVLDRAHIDGVDGIEDSVIGRNAVVRRFPAGGRGLRLMLGDDSEVLL